MMCCYSTLRPQKYRIHPIGKNSLHFILKKGKKKKKRKEKKKKRTREPLISLINLPVRLKIYYGPSQFHGFEEDFQHP